MRAAIDIGSNSVRLLLSDGSTYSHITQLAFGIEDTGRLSERGIAATVEALKEYAELCAERGCSDIVAFATEAVRKAADGMDFCAAVYKKTGIEVTVLSPEQEAVLALRGADKPSGAVTVVDLGGGSMEVICSTDGHAPTYVKSLPLGVVVAKNKYNGDYRRAIDELPAALTEYGRIPDYPVVVCGGSACNISAAELNLKVYDKKKVTRKMTVKQLDDVMPMLLSPKLTVFRPICRKRADTVPYGAIIIQALLNYIGATEFYVSDSSNLEAALNGALD